MRQEIKLDVGGVKFTTTKSTLLSKNSQFFNSLLDCTEPVIYIDRPGKYFDYILNYLRGNPFNVSNSDDKRMKTALAEEARFYGLWDLVDELLVTETEITVVTHIHKLTRVPIEPNFEWVSS